MTTNYHTVIATGAAVNASVVNSPLGQLDSAIGDRKVTIDLLCGGAGVSNEVLKGWASGENYEMTAITYDADFVVTTATVKWPDASAGTFTTTTKNTAYLAIDAYTITHTGSAKTVTQAAVTRNSDGNITVKPALTVA